MHETHLTARNERDWIRNMTTRQKKSHEYYLKNKVRIKARTKAWRIANRDRVLASRRIRYFEDHDRKKAKGRQYSARRRASGKAGQALRKWRANNRDRTNHLTAAHHARMIRGLTDTYVRMILRRNHGIVSPTPEQIENRRGIIAAKRVSRTMRLIHGATKLCKT